MSERTALLVDFGGALTTSVHDAFRAFSSQISGDPELVLRLLSRDAESSRLLVENECGRLDDEGFEHSSRPAWRRVAFTSPRAAC
jgi:putative hydrolase of the HAD superfamily